MASFCVIVLPGIEKWLYFLPQSQNNCKKYPVLSETVEPAMRSSLEVGAPAIPLMCRFDRLYPSPSSCFTCLICGESYVYWVQGNDSSVHSVTVTLFYDTLVLTALSWSSSSSSLASSPFLFLPWESISLNFLGSCYGNFMTRSLGFLELFVQLSLEFL